MQKLILSFVLLALLLQAEETLKIDFSQTGRPVEAGYEEYISLS